MLRFLTKNHKLKIISLWLMIFFYAVAGINHFINPEFYYSLIPNFLGHAILINIVSGFMEITLAAGLIYYRTRKLAAWGILLMLVAFIPSHVYFIQIGGCVEGGLCTGLPTAWIRLVLFHPLLLLWSYWHTQ